MAKEYIATISSIYTAEDTADPPDTIIPIVIPTVFSTKVLAGGIFIWYNNATFTVTVTVPDKGATIPSAPITGTWIASSTKTKEKFVNEFVCREGDESAPITATPQIPGSPPVNYPVTFTLKIQSAGQIKVSTE